MCLILGPSSLGCPGVVLRTLRENGMPPEIVRGWDEAVASPAAVRLEKSARVVAGLNRRSRRSP
jgi:hypothetical protein